MTPTVFWGMSLLKASHAFIMLRSLFESIVTQLAIELKLTFLTTLTSVTAPLRLKPALFYLRSRTGHTYEVKTVLFDPVFTSVSLTGQNF